MRIQDLSGKNICILGFGLEGKAMLAALNEYAPEGEITIADKNPDVQIEPGRHWQQTGSGWLQNLEKFDVIIKSPGIPPLSELLRVKEKLITGTQIFLDSIKESGSLVIGVTGSKGKSTTSTLIHKILSHSSKLKAQSFLIGNIGEPAIKHLKDAGKNTIFVQEMSSYQLMDLVSSPQIAVITAFFPEHLDYHGSLEAYLDVKKNIARFQTKSDVVFFAAESKESKIIADTSPGKKIACSEKDSPVTLEEISLKGRHNLGNIGLAFQVSRYLGIDEAETKTVIQRFKGLPHRLQSLGVIGGLEWIDDSISTTPESAIAALNALGDSVETIILGGQDRGYDFTPLVDRIKNSNVKNVILLPESGATIGILLKKKKIPFVTTDIMSEAVDAAVRMHRETRAPRVSTGKISIVLLSPASPSYGHFKNFEDRGEQFKKNIQRLHAED